MWNLNYRGTFFIFFFFFFFYFLVVASAPQSVYGWKSGRKCMYGDSWWMSASISSDIKRQVDQYHLKDAFKFCVSVILCLLHGFNHQYRSQNSLLSYCYHLISSLLKKSNDLQIFPFSRCAIIRLNLIKFTSEHLLLTSW